MTDTVDDIPGWYAEIFPAGVHDGFYQKLGDHSVVFVKRDPSRLIVSFDNLSDAGNPRFDREPWAAKFCRDNGWSHLGIFAPGPSWFRSADLIDFLDALRDQGFFEPFDDVTFCGASMGGFAAMVFSSLSPDSKVLAFSPQSTLDQSLVPWENRFQRGHDQDWNLPYSDAVDHVSSARRVYVVYDPMDAGDKQHVQRLSGSNVIHLTTIGLGHKSAMSINRMERLKDVMHAAVDGTLTQAQFRLWMQDRKNLYIYRKTVEGYLTAAEKPKLADAFNKAFKRRRRALNARLPEQPPPAIEEPSVFQPPEPRVPWPSQPGNVWMLMSSDDRMRYLSDRWRGQTVGFEERSGITLADTPPEALGVLAVGRSVAHPRTRQQSFEWHVVNETLSGDLPFDAASVHAGITQSIRQRDGIGYCTTVALAETNAPADGLDVMSEVLENKLMRRLAEATQSLRAWEKSLYVDRVCLSLELSEPDMTVDFAVQRYAEAAKTLRDAVSRVTGQNAYPHVIVSQRADAMSEGEVEAMLAEGRLDIDCPNLGFVVATPTYPFPKRSDAPTAHTASSLALIDELEVTALEHVHRGERWYCPSMEAASAHEDAIYVDFFCLSDLVLDGDIHGFALLNCSNDARITKVTVAGKTATLHLDKSAEGEGLQVSYALAEAGIEQPSYGQVRDSWVGESLCDAQTALYRFALSGRVDVLTRD